MSPPLGEGSEVAGKYRVVRHLGSGGMGHVYAARDLVRGETIALKVLPGDKRRDVRARSRLVLEGRAAGRDENIILIPPRQLTIETAMEWIDQDELVEITPDAIRLRKKILECNRRPKRVTAD